MKMKRKLVMVLSAFMLATAAMPAIAEQAELIELVESSGEGAPQTIAAPGASISTAEDSVTLRITGQEGLAMYAALGDALRMDLYAGSSVTFSGLTAGSYDLEVDYHDVQPGVHAFRTTVSVAGKTPEQDETTPPAQDETTPPPTQDETTPPPTQDETTPPPTQDETTPPPAQDETTPPAQDETTPPPTQSETTPPAQSVNQFELAVFVQDGVISAQISGASEREVEIALLLSGERVDLQSVIGDGTVAFKKQGDGVYTVRAAYVTPAEGIGPVEKTIEIKNTGSEGSVPDEKEPTVLQIGASVTSGDNWIEVKVTDADEWPLYVAVGDEYKVISRGESARFEGLSAGEYGIEADYVDPVSGVTPFRSSVLITKAPAGSIVFSAVGGENTIEVIVSDASVLPVTVTVKKDGAAVASKLIAGGIGRADFTGLAAGTYSVCVNYDPAQAGISEKEQTGIVVSDPASAPTVKEIAFSAVGGVQKIDVTVSQASNLPVSVIVKHGGAQVAQKTIAAGVGSVTFDGLAAGTYSVSVNYDPAQAGIAAKEQGNVIVAAQAIPVTLTSAVAGEYVLTITGTAQPGADIALVTTPAAETAVVARAGADGKFTAKITLPAGTYTKVTAICVSDNTQTATLSGTFVVTAPSAKPELSVDPITNKTQTVLARTTPGVKVNLRVKAYKYGQTVVADKNGLLRYSLPQTYPKGTEVTFTVYYGEDNAQSYVTIVNIVKEESYTLLKYGDSGSEVKKLTKRLEELGYIADDTSRYSSDVREAVKLFQEINGLDVDGIAGQKTQEALYSVGAISYGERGEYPTLVRGDKGLASIYRLQRRLKDLGYYTIAVDGIYGSGTERAVRHFQRINGLTQTGRADSATQKLLYSSSAKPADSASAEGYKVLSRSSKYYPEVVPLQRRLKALGYAVGSVDGYFGSRTYRAVREFQRRNGLAMTGIADETTQRVLFSSGAIAASGSSSSSSGSSSSSSSSYRLLYWGCTGDDVRALQNALLAKGYSEVRVADGIYGQWTYDAVRSFQKDHGLAVDGVAGKDTLGALYGVKY